MSRLHIGEFNDSFPPTIDGVAQAVKNYAEVMQKSCCDITVVTPEYKNVVDDYPFQVFRYPSVPLEKRIGYRAGNPFSIETLVKLRQSKMDLMHIHAPFASAVLVQNINRHHEAPVVFTYHTRFEDDLNKRIRSPGIRRLVIRFILENINYADEVWTVSEGGGKALRDIGYRGGYRVMENGTDFSFGRASLSETDALRERYGLDDGAFVFLYVGRMMWYKNIRLILDTLRLVKRAGLPFHMLMVGGGLDSDAIRRYAAENGLENEMIFTGPIYDREELRTYYSAADAFLFPSTFDTSGIVVKEAAACECPSLLVRGSCAAECVRHPDSGILAEEDAASCAQALLAACESRESLRQLGVNAGKTVYLSWNTVAERAFHRYQEILNTPRHQLTYNARSVWI